MPGRTFEELLAAARTISKGDVEGIEQLIVETLNINNRIVKASLECL